MEYILLAIVVIGFGITIIQIQLKRARMKPSRDVIVRQELTYRDRAAVKVMLPSGWSRKTLGGMKLAVRTDAIELSLAFPSLGGFLGSEWYFKATDAQIEISHEPSLRIYPRDWIVITGRQLDKEVEVAVSPKGGVHDAWAALVAAGATPAGPPPE